MTKKLLVIDWLIFLAGTWHFSRKNLTMIRWKYASIHLVKNEATFPKINLFDYYMFLECYIPTTFAEITVRS